MNNNLIEFIKQFGPIVLGIIIIFLILRWLKQPRKKGSQYSSLPGEGRNNRKPKGRMTNFGKSGLTGQRTRKQ